MRVLMIAWEFLSPSTDDAPRGRIAALSAALVPEGHAVTVVTRHAAGRPDVELCNGVRVVRAAAPGADVSGGALGQTMAFNHTLTPGRAAGNRDRRVYDVIHAHDWLVTHTAVTLKESPRPARWSPPIHATEAGRHQGWLPDEMNSCIHPSSGGSAHEACRVLVCSEYMRWEVQTRLLRPRAGARVSVVASTASTPTVWRAPARAGSSPPAPGSPARAPSSATPVAWFYEKGVQDLIAALPEPCAPDTPALRVVIAGDGAPPHRAPGGGAAAAGCSGLSASPASTGRGRASCRR